MRRFFSLLRSKSRRAGPLYQPCCEHVEPETEDASGPVFDPIVLSTAELAELPIESFPSRDKSNVSWQTLLSSPSTSSDTFTIGIAVCEPEIGQLALHRHKQAEIYHIISGIGVVEIEGREFMVTRGDVLFIPGNAEHGVRNPYGEELKWLYCFAATGFQDIVYRFSNNNSESRGVDAKLL